MYQKLTIVGNLGQDPELRYTPDGTPVANFSVATNRRWSTPEGDQKEETAWFRVTAWRRTAEVCNQYLQKGRQVLVEGRLRPDPAGGGPRVFQRQDGTYGASYEVIADSIRFLGTRGEVAAEIPDAAEVVEEEIPFG